ncbi:MAG: hypothetical protein ACHQNT_01765 [Bacteroidia bacterium]
MLILDASSLGRSWGDFETVLAEKLKEDTNLDFRIFNLSTAGHTSMDSYFKYEFLKDKKFDLVLFYSGINESRANNCPTDVFKNDFSHYVWYKQLHALRRHKEICFTALPYTLEYCLIYLDDYFGFSKNISLYGINKEWMDYGSVLKAQTTYKENLSGIIDLSKKKNEKLLLMTLAYYLPANYSLEKFKSKSLDYSNHGSPVEIWGKPENVVAGIEMHNRIVKQLAVTNAGNVLFIDMETKLPKGKKYFNDICHFTHTGSEKFADEVMGVIKELQ